MGLVRIRFNVLGGLFVDALSLLHVAPSVHQSHHIAVLDPNRIRLLLHSRHNSSLSSIFARKNLDLVIHKDTPVFDSGRGRDFWTLIDKVPASNLWGHFSVVRCFLFFVQVFL